MRAFGIETTSELQNKLSMIVRVGYVVEVDSATHKAKVRFSDEDSDSHWLRILCKNSFKNKDYNMVDLDEDVLCLCMPDGIEDGFILGSFYTGAIICPSSDINERKIQFEDDTTVTYNRCTHSLDIKINDTTIHADREIIDISSPNKINLNSKDINITASTVTIAGKSSVKVTAPNVAIN